MGLKERTGSMGRRAMEVHGRLPSTVRRPLTVAVGLALLLAGILLLVLPGPGLLLLALGLAVLALELSWARRLVAATRRHLERARSS